MKSPTVHRYESASFDWELPLLTMVEDIVYQQKGPFFYWISQLLCYDQSELPNHLGPKASGKHDPPKPEVHGRSGIPARVNLRSLCDVGTLTFP